MLIYPNVPSWGSSEFRHAFVALTSRAAARDSVEGLRQAIEQDVPGWSATLLGSGRHALQVALDTLGLQNARLAVPAYVCPAVVTAIRGAGATIVPIDCGRDSIRFDVAALKEAVRGRRVDAVIAANTYGLDQDFDVLQGLGVPVIDDAAYQAGAIDGTRNVRCGTRGAAGIWSFNFKALIGLGGGILLLPSGTSPSSASGSRNTQGDVARFLNYAVRSIVRHHIPRTAPFARFRAPETADNVRTAWQTVRGGAMTDLQAALALGQWNRREKLHAAHATHAAALIDEANASEAFVQLTGGSNRSAHFVPLLVTARGGDAAAAVDHARRCLYVDGIQTETAYPVVLGPAAALPHAVELSARLFLLPCHAALDTEQIHRMRRALRRASGELTARFRPDMELLNRTSWSASSRNLHRPLSRPS